MFCRLGKSIGRAGYQSLPSRPVVREAFAAFDFRLSRGWLSDVLSQTVTDNTFTSARPAWSLGLYVQYILILSINDTMHRNDFVRLERLSLWLLG
jgi:hypothetical protein